MSNKLLKEHAVADRLGLSVWTLRKYRSEGGGPRFVKIGSSVRYTEDDIAEYIRQNTRHSTVA